MVGGCRIEVFDRAGNLQAALYTIDHIEDNSTAALSSQAGYFFANHFFVRGRIRVDTRFSPRFQILQIGFQMLPGPINSVEMSTSV